MTKEQLTEIIKHVTPTIQDAEILAEYLIANGIVVFAGEEQTNRQWLIEQDDKTFAKVIYDEFGYYDVTIEEITKWLKSKHKEVKRW